MNFSELTTIRVGGPAASLTIANTRADLVEFCQAHPLAAGAPTALFVAGGSNLLVSDEGFDGDTCVVRTQGVEITSLGESLVQVEAEAGENWDAFVASCCAYGLSGLEALSGIPGSVGATPVQNVGAYGAEVADVITEVRVFDRASGDIVRLPKRELRFGYRTSLLKQEAQRLGQPRFVVLSVTFELQRSAESGPVRYAQLAGELEVELGERSTVSAVRSAVLALRASKGMVLDSADHDTWSLGSFFTNPILESADDVPEDAPRYPVIDPATGAEVPGAVKTSAAWLIDRAGFARGFRVGSGAAALSDKHTLALTNRGEASCADVVHLAAVIRDGVEDRFGIRLEPEPLLVGAHLPD